ncbi:MAG: glutamate ligase domain-containing protein, partial [Pseudonocardiaceae bacterium]
WAVLGPLGELGDAERATYDELGRLAARLGVGRLVVVGEQARPLHQAAQQEGLTGEGSVLVPDVQAALTLLRTETAPGDVVLVKASRAFELQRIADGLHEPAAAAGGSGR